LATKVDKTGLTIGKRYARTDEIGIPLGITIDFDTVNKGLVTLRESLSMKQVQLPLKEVVNVVKNLCSSEVKWEDVIKTYPIYEGNQDEQQ
jgi:glycyl-tRNA synthetase